MAPMGYARALDLLREILAECCAGRGQVVMIEGGLAGGKTHLLHEFSRIAGDTGAALLYATSSRAEQKLEMGVIDQLFRNGGPEDDNGDDRPGRPLPDVHEWEHPPGQAGLPSVAAASRVREVCGAFLEMSRERPLVVAVDDVHFADSASLRVLLSLQRRMKSAAVMLVLTEWARTHPSRPDFLAQLTRQPCCRIRLTPPSMAETRRLVGETLGEDCAGQLACTFQQLTNGNPLLVQALVDDYRTAKPGDADVEPPVGTSYAHAVLACLHRWEPPLLDVAQAAAVLGDWSSPALISRLLDIRSELVEDVVAILTDAGLLRNAKFRHPVARGAVLASLTPASRCEIHQRAADLLFQQGAAACDVADHLLTACRAEDGWTYQVLRTAADQALADGDTETAVRCLKMALDCCEDKKERLTITLALARTLWRVNPALAVPYLGELQDAVRADELAPRDAAVVVRYSLWQGDGQAASETLGALLASPGLTDSQSVAELAVAYQWFFGPSRDQCGQLILDRSARKDAWADATNRLASLWTRGGMAAAAASARQILQSCRLEDTPIEVVGMAVWALMAIGKVDLARSWCERLIQEAERRNEVTWQAVLVGIDAAAALRRGDPAGAAARADLALELLPSLGWGVLIGQPKSTLLLAYAAVGKDDPAVDLLRPPSEEFSTVFGLRYLHARGHYFLATGQPLAASRDFQLCGTLMRERGVDVPALIPWRSDLAQANLTLGRTGEARDLVKQQLEQAKSIEQGKVIDTRTRGISLRVLAATSELAQRPAMLHRAVEYLQAADDRLELARALTELSATYQQIGESERARGFARRAAQVTQVSQAGPATPAPARGPRRAAAAEPGGSDPRRAATEASHPVLSSAELRVVELAALGHTNREISRELYITVSTVEQHLTHAYRKLGISTRADLHSELARTRSSPYSQQVAALP